MTDPARTVNTSAPVRLDFAGAWTDVAPYAIEARGVVVNAAIELRTRVELRLPNDGYELWARDLDEKATDLARDGRLELLKAAVRHGDLGPCALHCGAEAPPGSGLGSSGALSVALVCALDELHGRSRGACELAESAWHLETVDAAVAGGRQDQYAAAMGGFQRLVFDHGSTTADPIALDPRFADELERHTIICYTGRSRFSGSVITRVMQEYQTGNRDVAGALDALADIGESMAEAFRNGELPQIGNLLGANWREQQRLDAGMCTPEMARLEAAMRASGAAGGKAAGAGAGGSMFFVVPGDVTRARQAARECGATLLPLRWATRGAGAD